MRYGASIALSILFAVSSVFADTTYTTLSGSVNLVAGLDNLTVTTAINTTNQATGIQAITDSSWSTAIFNLGAEGILGSPLTANNGSLAGTFGSGTYYGSANSIILIGSYGTSAAWGSWTVRLLLSDNSYSSAITYSNTNLLLNPTVTFNAGESSYFNGDGSTFSPGAAKTLYQILDISAFDTGNIGVKGFEMSGMSANFPDISYIGVTAVPEPSALSLLAIGLGGLALLKRRKI